MKKVNKEDLVFLPLGGSNEIGMNVNLYHYKGKWLMIDLGAGFADDHYPGVQMLAPDLSFVYQNADNFLGLVLTHAHEDHIGSVTYLWEKLKCPIYATPFTAAMARSKLKEAGFSEKEAKITEIKPGSDFEIGPFSLHMIQITHSIPEMNGIVIRTEYGNILHTGDWKLDPNPVIGPTTDEKALKALGAEGVLAMVCDSTNVFNDRFSGSEGDLQKNISQLVSECMGLAVVTTFASNVARIATISRAAKENGRKVVLAGWSLKRISGIARETGYLLDIDSFLSEEEIKKYPKKELLIICTGCQGEPNAAMNKIANGKHPHIRLTPKDTVIFSSKIIPGNEKKIFKLFNTFVRLGCEVFTEKDHLVHVSGHPSRAELTKMYEMVKPKVAIPVHGEPMHLHEHSKLARSLGVKKAIEVQNGDMIKIAPGEAEIVGFAECGYFAVDGKNLQPENGDVMKMRRNMQKDGIIFVSIVMNTDGGLAVEPIISTPGVIDEKENRAFLKHISEELIEVIDEQRDTSDDKIFKITRKVLRRIFQEETGKFPVISIHVSHI